MPLRYFRALGELYSASPWCKARVQSSLKRIESATRRKLTRGPKLLASALLRDARRLVSDLTLDELTAARIIASERSRGTAAEMACLVDAELNRAERKGVSLTEHATGGTLVYGPQGGRRPVATRQNANLRNLAAARAVMSGSLRGISRGAERFFDPLVQQRQHQKFVDGRSGRVHSCSARGVLKAWSYDLPTCIKTKTKRRRCCEDGMPPSDKEAGESLTTP